MASSIRSVHLVPALVVAVLFGASPTTGRTAAIETVVLSGDVSPAAPDATFTAFHAPVLNGGGSVAFWGLASETQGLYRRTAGGHLEVIAQAGQALPGLGGRFVKFQHLVQNEAGDVAFTATIATPDGGATTSIWIKPEGAPLRLVARAGAAAPGTTDAFGSFPGQPLLDDDGEVAFYAVLSGQPLSGIWMTSGGDPELIALKDQTAPGTDERFTYFSDLVMNSNGDLAFFGTLAGGGAGLWRMQGAGALQLVVRDGSPLPGGGTLASVSEHGLVLNAKGDLAFAETSAAPRTYANRRIWTVSTAGALTEVLRSNEVAPGGSGVFGGSVRPFAYGSNGRLGLVSQMVTLEGSSGRRGFRSGLTLYRQSATGSIGLVVRGNELPPTGGSDPVLSSLWFLGSNDLGDIAGVKGRREAGIFIKRASGGLFTLAPGDSLEITPDDVRRVVAAWTIGSGPAVAGRSGLTDAGDLVFKAEFEDSTQGIFVLSTGGSGAVRVLSGTPEPRDVPDIRRLARDRCAEPLPPADRDPLERFRRLEYMAKCAFEAGNFERAKEYAQELLGTAGRYVDDFSYGGALHHWNLVLGRLSLANGEIEEAKRYLLEAGRTPGGPALGSFGPSMTLAKELLELGEQDAVIAYFDLCARFWRSEGGRLAEWKSAVAAGEMPDFGTNLRY